MYYFSQFYNFYNILIKKKKTKFEFGDRQSILVF